MTPEERNMAELKRQNEMLQEELRQADKRYIKICQLVDELEEENKKCKRVLQTYKSIRA